MYTSLALVALSSFLALAVPEERHPWLSDYSLAALQGQNEKKPLAVFVGSGPAGWDKLSKDGKLGEEVQRILESHYVCVYVDTSRNHGKQLAAAFELDDSTGIVISDRTGGIQAFHHEGDLYNRDLERYLRKYADPNFVVRGTEINLSEEVSYYPPSFSRPVGGGRGC